MTAAVQLNPATAELLGQVELFRVAAIANLASAASDEARWNLRVALTAYELAAARGLRPVELVRVAASDVSLSRGVLLLRHPKATRRGADPRVVPLGRTLIDNLEPLLDGLRRTGRDDAPLLSWWRDGVLQPASPKQITEMAREICGGVSPLGMFRHLSLQLLEALEQGATTGPGSYAMQRSRSAAVGHGQSGGWSVYLGVDPVIVREVFDRLDQYLAWKPTPEARTLVPPSTQPLKTRRRPSSRESRPGGRSDWATLGLESSGVELDLMGPAYERLWQFRWADLFGLGREEALATALFIQVLGFGEILLPTDCLRTLTWNDLDRSDDGLLLSLSLPNASGKLGIWVGPAELLLFRQLRVAGAAQPFSRVRADIIRPLLEWMFGRQVTLEELQRTNRLAHVVTHPPDHIGYLSGRVSHKLLVDVDVATNVDVRNRPDSALQALDRLLRRRTERVTQKELDRLLDAVLPTWQSWPASEDGRLSPRLIVETLRLCCGSVMRNGLRSRSPGTVRALLHELCLVRTVLGDRPIHQLTKADVDVALGGRRAETRLSSALHWLARACRKEGVQSARQYRVSELRFFHPVRLPRSADLYPVIEKYEESLRPLVGLVLMCCCVARKSEIGRLRLGDLIMDDRVLLIDIGAAKGGRAAPRQVRAPGVLRALIPRMRRYIDEGDPDRRLIQPLGARSSSTDAIFQRLSYRLAGLGIRWTPHMMRSIASTEARKAGRDPAQIAAALGHKLVSTTVQHYIAFDPLEVRPRAVTLADSFPHQLTSPALACVFGVSTRAAEDIHRKTGGDMRLLARSNLRHRAA